MTTPSKDLYRGLTKSFHVSPGPRTAHSAVKRIPFLQNLFPGSEEWEIETDRVYPYSPQMCFDMLSDYREYLLMALKDNEAEAKKELGLDEFFAEPSYLGDLDGAVGSRVVYAYYLDKRVYHRVDRVIQKEQARDDPDGNEVFKFVVRTEQKATLPAFPMGGLTTAFVFTRFNKDPNQCHVRLICRWRSPRIGSEGTLMKTILQDRLERYLFRLRILIQATYSPKLPKTDSRILVIGAGPSGLHMSYELIQRGVSPENITILEKDDRYGGKTKSRISKADKQVSDAVFNSPESALAALPLTGFIMGLISDIEVWVKQFIYGLLNPGAKPLELLAVERSVRPGALQGQDPDDYFRDGEQVYHEMGTCYLSPSYYMVRKLLREIQDKVEDKAAGELNRQGKWSRLAVIDITREVYPNSYAIEGEKLLPPNIFQRFLYSLGLWKPPLYLDMIQWLTMNVVKNLTGFWRRLANIPLFAMGATMSSLLTAKIRYCNLHENLMGFYQFSMPPLPDEGRLEKLMMNFGDFMDENNLGDLRPLFAYALTAQGYGLLSDTPTFLAMQWLTPDLLDGYIEWYAYFQAGYKDTSGDLKRPIPEDLQKYDNGQKAMLVSGWGALWDRIVELYDFLGTGRLKLETTLTSIKRENGKVYATYTHGGVDYSEEFDYLVLGASLSDAAIDSQAQLPDLPLDTTPSEKHFLLSKEWETSIFKTNVFHPNSNGNFSDNHLRIFAPNLLEDTAESQGLPAPGQAQVFAMRDSYKAVQPKLSTEFGDKFDPRGSFAAENAAAVGQEVTVREKMCYQFISPARVASGELSDEHKREEVLEKELVAFFDEHDDFKSSTAQILERKGWTYYTHYGKNGLLNYMLWHLMSTQGLNNTFFVHASASFESVLDIANYNVMLLDGLAGRLDSYIRPPSDPRPSPQERPSRLMVQRGLRKLKPLYHLGILVDYAFYAVYSVFYNLSYPIYEGIFARITRKQLQVDFLTPGMDNFSWTYFDMKGFLMVSPSVRGFHEIYNPPLADEPDSVFEILEAPDSIFKDRQPTIPRRGEITSSIEWNLSDTRQGLRHWLYVIKDNFNPFAIPIIGKIIPGLDYLVEQSFLFLQSWLPNTFGWLFSFGFALKFRNIVGFAYRFSDELGGGVKIPDCHMLRVAREEFGTRVGQKFCFTVCKVFTEEAMRKYNLKMDFQPDFLKGSGNGCTVRIDSNVEQAFSDNEIDRFRTKKDQERFKEIGLDW